MEYIAKLDQAQGKCCNDASDVQLHEMIARNYNANNHKALTEDS